MGAASGQIIALGGGGFSNDRDPELDRYLLRQARSTRPSIAFIGTASGDSDRYLAKFYAAFARHDCRPSHLGLFGRAPDLGSWVAAQDVIFVGGGNTRSMLAVWREWGLPDLLRAACEAGTVLAGISAGAICWFEQGVTDSEAGSLTALVGLGLVPGSCCPHYDGEPERRPGYHELLASGAIASGIAIDEDVAVHFVAGKPHRVVAARATAGAYRVERVGDSVVESSLAAERVELAGGPYGDFRDPEPSETRSE